jgi:hypothetical protein
VNTQVIAQVNSVQIYKVNLSRGLASLRSCKSQQCKKVQKKRKKDNIQNSMPGSRTLRYRVLHFRSMRGGNVTDTPAWIVFDTQQPLIKNDKSPSHLAGTENFFKWGEADSLDKRNMQTKEKRGDDGRQA